LSSTKLCAIFTEDEVADLKRGTNMKQTKEIGEISKNHSDESENKELAKAIYKFKESNRKMLSK